MYSYPRYVTRWGRLALLLGVGALFGAASASAQEQLLFSESFETDGAGSRYTVINGSDDGSNDYFARRQIGSAGTRVRGAIDGQWFWTQRDVDAESLGNLPEGLEDDEGLLIWNEVIDIAGLGNLRLEVLAAQGGDEQEWDNVVAFQLRFDGGEWINIGGFRGIHTDSASRYFVGDLRTFPDFDDPQLTAQFSSWSWDVPARGDTVEIRMYTNMNGGSEEVAFDDLKLYATPGLAIADFAVSADTFAEDAGTGEITISLPTAAPAGGVTFTVANTDDDGDEVNMPSSITVPAGETEVTVPFEVIADGRFDGDELVIVNLDGPGYARDQVRFTVTNLDARPNVIINEFLPVLDNLEDNVAPEDLPLYDVNGDGRSDEDEEQFIEIVNLEAFPVDISGWTVNDELQTRHVFPEGTVLPAGGVILVFADAIPRGVFGGAIVQVTRLVSPNFDEDGDIAQLLAGGAVVDSIAYTGELGETYDSITRFPDLTGSADSVQDHSQIPEANGALWSPGTRVDGSYFFAFDDELTLTLSSDTVAEGQVDIQGTVSLNNPAPAGGVTVSLKTGGGNPDELNVPAEVVIPEGQTSVNFLASAPTDGILDGDRELEVRAEAAGKLPAVFYLTVTDTAADLSEVVINEAFGDVLGSSSDANGNGEIEEPVGDQFIEVVNVAETIVDLSGWELVSWRPSKPGGPRTVHVFPAGTIVDAGGSVVVIGRGDEGALQAQSDTLFGGAIVQVANSDPNGVNVTSDDGETGEISLLTPYGYVEDRVTFEGEDENQSLTRSPDMTGAFGALHLEVSPAFAVSSPGTMFDGSPFAGNGMVEGVLSPRGFFTSTVELSGGWWFNASLGAVWSGLGTFPYVYLLNYEGWVFVFVNEGTTEAEYFLYDFKTGQFGFTGTGFYPDYFVAPDFETSVNLNP